MKENATFELGGEVGERIKAVVEQWVLPAPHANPGMLEMFRYRDHKPYSGLMPWAGEFAGKYLTHAVQIYRLTRDLRLENQIAWFVGEMVARQDPDGYLGPWQKGWHLRRGAPNCTEAWDAWGHYHIMLGMLLWFETSGDKRALSCAKKIGDLLCGRFLGDGGETLHETGCQEMNLAPMHSLAILYRVTAEKRYLDLALQILQELEIPPAGDHLRCALAGKEFHETPKPRWESLHSIMGLAELYRATKDERLRRAFEQIWWSIVKTDRHNNGGFSSGERAQGNPYHAGPIETCSTVAWTAMTVEMLDLTRNSIVADELELTLLNSGLGTISPSGRWVTYNTPMAGQKLASAHDVVFQARAGTAELNCCSVNGPRLLGMISDWAVSAREDGLALNYFGPSRISTRLRSGHTIELVQQTDYPRNNRVQLTVTLETIEEFTLALRIPHWSKETRVAINAADLSKPQAGRYLEIRREWKSGDTVLLDLDFRPHFWLHELRAPSIPWEAEWTAFGAIAPATSLPPEQWKDAMPGDQAVEIPGSLEAGGKNQEGIAVRSIGGLIDFVEILPRDSKYYTALAYTSLEAPEDEIRSVVFSAGWWCCWFVNGQKIYDNHATGGNQGEAIQRLHRLALPLKKGKNVVLARVTSSAPNRWRNPSEWTMNVGWESNDAKTAFTSIYRGPILLAYDPRFNSGTEMPGPLLDATSLSIYTIDIADWLKPWMLLEARATDGAKVLLCDFASAGNAGGPPYDSWLPVQFPLELKLTEFSKDNPLRSSRLNQTAD